MRKIGLAFALLASVSMTVLPVAPGYAATSAPSKSATPPQSAKQALAKHAARGEAAIISKAQLDRLAVTHPRLHAKIVAANQAGTNLNQFLHGRGIQQFTVYHPADRFWTFQLIEAALFVAVAAVLIGVVVWRVRRRMI